MSSDCPLIEPEASKGGRLGERNGTEEEKSTLCMFLSSFVKVWGMSTFQVALTIPCISGRFSQGYRTREHSL